MKFRWLTLVALLFLVPMTSRLPADEPYIEFVEGLREREGYDYYEIAIFYLEKIEAKPNLPPAVKELLPFEKAITYLEWVRSGSIRGPEEQTKKLDLAKTYFEQFLKASPEHPKAAGANTDLANVLIGKGRVEVLQSRSPSNSAQKEEFQKKGREYIVQARAVFQQAHDLYEKRYKEFPSFIDQKNKAEHEAREKAMLNYIQAQLNLAIATYEEAQTYDRSPDLKAPFRTTLTNASNEFEKIHAKYRSQVAGLYARMWQGKCFEEQGDITKALGIYNELLQNPGHSKAMITLQIRVMSFKLICLNDDQRKDYQVVDQEADAAMRQMPSNQKNGTVGSAIQWEQARACEMQAKKEDISAKERDRLLRKAEGIAKNLARSSGVYREVAVVMMRRIGLLLNREAGDPKDFDTAYQIANDMVKDIAKKNEARREAKSPEKEKLDADFLKHIQEMTRILNLALELYTPKDDVKELNKARYYLSYAYWLTKGKSYESAVIGDYIARHYYGADPDAAMDAAYLSMVAYMQAYSASPAKDREAELNRVTKICSFITEKWPKNEKANEARMNLGRLYSQNKQPDKAAEVFAEIPESAPQYLDAQLAAGQAFWQAYCERVILPEDQRPPKDQLEPLQARAQQILRDAMAKLEAKMTADAPPRDDLTAGKLSLVQILNGTGDYKGALALLKDGPRSVGTAVAVTDEKLRPERGIKGKRFAVATYYEMLRSYVGTQQLDQARATMKELEKIGGGGANLNVILRQLGDELEKEVRRLQAAKDPRLPDVLKSFETFLDDMAKRDDSQNFNTLSWIGETYKAMGEGVDEGDPAKSEAYFSKAGATYQVLLNLGDKPGGVPKEGITGVQLQLVKCKRRQKSFDEALKMVEEILKAKPRALDAQEEAALVYQDWAARGGPDDWGKWDMAIQGDRPGTGGKSGDEKQKRIVWGWSDLAQRLASNLMQQGKSNPDFERQYLDARFNIAFCRFKFAMAQSKTDQKKKLLEMAKRDVIVTATLNGSLLVGDIWEKFNKLFREIQKDMVEVGVQKTAIADLEKKVTPTEKPAAKKETKTAEATPEKKKKKAAKADKKPEVAKSGGAGLWIGVVVVLLAAGGGGAYFFMNNKKKPAVAAKPQPAAQTAATAQKKKPPAKAKT